MPMGDNARTEILRAKGQFLTSCELLAWLNIKIEACLALWFAIILSPHETIDPSAYLGPVRI